MPSPCYFFHLEKREKTIERFKIFIPSRYFIQWLIRARKGYQKSNLGLQDEVNLCQWERHNAFSVRENPIHEGFSLGLIMQFLIRERRD